VAWDDKLGVTAMIVGGLAALVLWPRKTRDLVLHGKGWYDDELDRREAEDRRRAR
jgi:hypothetical protein